MMGRVWMEKGDYAKAVESLERVIDQDKELVGETLEMLQTCYQQLGKTDEWEVFLRRCVEENAGATAELMLAQILEQREGVEAAQNYVTRQLERHPTMRVFHKLMDYHLNEAEEGRAKESLGVLTKHGWRAGAQQTTLSLPEMRVYRSYTLLALSVLPLVGDH